MSASAAELTMGNGIREIEHVASIFHKRGETLEVAVKDAGYGPAIDVRLHVNADKYQVGRSAGSTRNVDAYHKRVQRRNREYVGPTKQGVWMGSLEEACALLEALSKAIDRAEALGGAS